MASKVGAMFGECMERMALAEKVPKNLRESESGIFWRWIRGEVGGLRLLILSLT